MAARTVRRIVCLANSRMPRGSCIAGKVLESDGRPGSWVRPVGGRENEGVAARESRYADGGAPSLLDIMDVPLLSAQPKDHQQENWLLDPNHRWAKVGRLGLVDLSEWTDEPETLWVNGCSTSKGHNDRVKASDADSPGNSLCLIKVNLNVWVFDYYYRRVQGRFRHKGTDYWLWVTDPDYEQEYKPRPDGRYQLGECFVTVSLAGANRDGYCYKLIAAIIKP